MSKRFTDTDKWRDPWFCSISTPEKLFWTYLLDTCNLAGIWQVNWPLVKFYIPDFEYKKETFEGRVQIVKNDKWIIKKFAHFQYGELVPEKNRLHQRVVFELQKEGVSTPLIRGAGGDKDMDMDKVYVKDNSINAPNFKKPIPKEITDYASSINFSLEGDHFFDYYESNGWMVGKTKMKDWKATVRTWKRNGYTKSTEDKNSWKHHLIDQIKAKNQSESN